LLKSRNKHPALPMKNLLAALGVRIEKAEVSQETGLRLEGKVAIVTGGDTGIGKAISIALSREGAKIVIDYYGDGSPASALVNQIQSAGGSAYAVAADVSDPQQAAQLVQAVVERYGKIDILVNNAGVEQKRAFLDMPLDVYAKVIAVNLTGVWLCSQLAARQMVEQKTGGRIINISSIHEEIAMPTNAPYCAAKGGVRMLARTLSVELAPHRITVNNVCPGAIETPMDTHVEHDPEEYERLIGEIPMHRMGKPEDVAAMCVYLATEAAAYVTGASLFIDGGMSKKSGSL
jgi:glucose 1-dehydrogenase